MAYPMQSRFPVTTPSQPLRRQLLGVACALGGALVLPARAHNAAGVVNPPVLPPATPVQLNDGKNSQLSTLFKGKITALQLMFTGCSATCPIQGALFAAVLGKLQALKPGLPQAQLMSLSIDPLNDDPRALTEWLNKFGGGKSWMAAAPSLKSLDPFLDFLQGRAKNADRHTGQVYLFDPLGRLVLRTIDFPPTEVVIQRMQELAALHASAK